MGSVKFSEHALLKLQLLKAHGIEPDSGIIESVVRNPNKVEQGYKGRKVAQGRLSERHVLRVVYEEAGEGVVIITFYPGRRERYEEDQVQ